MEEKSTETDPAAAATRLSRRDLLGFAANGAAMVVVSQLLLGRAKSAVGAESGAPASPQASCVQTAALTEGPFFVDERLNRSDIRDDPATGVVSAGVPLRLRFNVQRVESGACTPLTGAYLDVWHCDAAGTYSGVTGRGNGPGGAERSFLRGYQVTDAGGAAEFLTVYPGWYSGRAVHVHFKLRLFAGSARTYEFTSQFFFDESLTDAVHALSPYREKGRRNVINSRDGIYNDLSAAEKTALTLHTTRDGDGYAGVIDLGVRVG